VEVLILKGLRCPKNRQNKAKRGIPRIIHSNGLTWNDRRQRPKKQKAAEGLPHSPFARFPKKEYSRKLKKGAGQF
jgi:hypothetical protein